MKPLKFLLSACLLFFMVTTSCSQKKNAGSSPVLGVFLASTPCSQGTKPLPGIPAGENVELIKWNLTLFQDSDKKTPASYKLHCVYGLSQPGTTGFIGGGKKIDMEGKCTITKGTASNAGAIVYQLHDDKTNATISFAKLNDNLLHLLDSDGRLMIGSAAWSYTLNRTVSK